MGRTHKSSGTKYTNYKKISNRHDTINERHLDRDDKLLDMEENKMLMSAADEDQDIAKDQVPDSTERYLDPASILSPELLQQTDSVMVSGRKKQKTSQKEVELSPTEIKAAKKESKRMKRKLKQLADRRVKKEARTEVYETLEANKLTDAEYNLMSSSSKLGHTLTKKERLKRYLDLERAGIKLSAQERDELYVEKEDISDDEKVSQLLHVLSLCLQLHSNTPTPPHPTPADRRGHGHRLRHAREGQRNDEQVQRSQFQSEQEEEEGDAEGEDGRGGRRGQEEEGVGRNMEG